MRVIYRLPNGSGTFRENDGEIPETESIIKCGLKEYVVGSVFTFGDISSGITEAVCYLKEKS